MPSTVLGYKSPFEMLYGRSPSLAHMRVIGCLCFATVLPRQDKFGPRAIKDFPFLLANENSTSIIPGVNSLPSDHEADEFLVAVDSHSNAPMFSPAHVQHAADGSSPAHMVDHGDPQEVESVPADNLIAQLLHIDQSFPIVNVLHRPARTLKPPIGLKDYFSGEVEPRNYSDAGKDPRWVEAMQAEIQALEDNKT
ncbi:uncharacterized protein [Nicotiana tomentosiformis]|uniref:uncharacterized protein n=1 Tax=Nicotiana tomentosiformis TaxID=4098 RepID=UPI00388CB1EE